jgi:hypothetical protein
VAKNNKQIMIDFVARLNKQIEATTGPEEMKAIGKFLIGKIAVRTRLGNGVNNHLDEKSKLKKLSPKYVEYRKTYAHLSNMTKPRMSNLTRTGSMIDSLSIKAIGKNSIRIGPTGTDRNGVSNSSKAYWQEKAGRVFLRLSKQEVKLARIFWMRTFSDLLK